MAAKELDVSPLGRVIRERLNALGGKAAGKTQAWLAEQVGVSNNAVSKWMRTSEITHKHAVEVARALRIPVEALAACETADDMRQLALRANQRNGVYAVALHSQPIAVERGPPDLQALVEIATQLSVHNRAKLIRVAVELLKEQPPTKKAEKRAS